VLQQTEVHSGSEAAMSGAPAERRPSEKIGSGREARICCKLLI